jgi:hypothetical protein
MLNILYVRALKCVKVGFHSKKINFRGAVRLSTITQQWVSRTVLSQQRAFLLLSGKTLRSLSWKTPVPSPQVSGRKCGSGPGNQLSSVEGDTVLQHCLTLFPPAPGFANRVSEFTSFLVSLFSSVSASLPLLCCLLLSFPSFNSCSLSPRISNSLWVPYVLFPSTLPHIKGFN